jgi:hypothetical protein
MKINTLIPAAPGFYQIGRCKDGTYRSSPIVAWQVDSDLSVIPLSLDGGKEVDAIEYPNGIVRVMENGRLYPSYTAFTGERERAGPDCGMKRSEAIAYLMLIKGETASRDYGPGIDKIIALLREL